MDSNRRMRSLNVQGFASKVLTLYEEEVRRIRKRLRSAVRLYAHMQFTFYIVFLCNGIYNVPLLSAVTEKRVSVPEAHKIEYVPMHTIREITRLATMLAGLIAPQLRLGFVSALPQLRMGYTSTTPHLRLDYALAPIFCEHCRSSRNNPHCVPRHVIFYFSTRAYNDEF